MHHVNTNENAICDLEYNSNCAIRYNIMDQDKITFFLLCICLESAYFIKEFSCFSFDVSSPITKYREVSDLQYCTIQYIYKHNVYNISVLRNLNNI